MTDAAISTAAPRKTPQLLKELRGLRVAVLHPRDPDGELLVAHLERIGCKVHLFWPPSLIPPDDTDLVFLAVRPDTLECDFAWAHSEAAPVIIAVIEYENPTIVELVLRIGAKGVVAKPIRTAGILSTIVLARAVHAEMRALQKKAHRLEQKLSAFNLVSEAKLVLIRTRNLNEEQAYTFLREQAMRKRCSIEELARAVINANQLLGF